MTDRRAAVLLALLGLSMFPGCDDGPRQIDTACGPVPAPTGALPAGWTTRFDEAEGTAADLELTVVDGGGFEAVVHGNVILWRSDARSSGDYHLAVDVTQMLSLAHPHGAGLFFGGAALDTEEQVYTYFLVRGDGHFIIKTRDGAKTEVVAAWTAHAALQVEGEDFKMHNRLEVIVRADVVRFLVNGQEVHRAPRGELHTEGYFGYRAVHDLRLRLGAIQHETVP